MKVGFNGVIEITPPPGWNVPDTQNWDVSKTHINTKEILAHVCLLSGQIIQAAHIYFNGVEVCVGVEPELKYTLGVN